jgi:hypothetical protein
MNPKVLQPDAVSDHDEHLVMASKLGALENPKTTPHCKALGI